MLVDANGTEGTGALHHEFLDACPKTDAMFYQRFFDNSDLAPYTQDTTKDFATSVRMAREGPALERQGIKFPYL